MRTYLRLYAGFAVFLAIVVVVVLLGERGGRGSDEESLPPKLGVNRIVYVTLDNRIIAVNPDGTEPQQISPAEGIYTWPTWSPDARKLVYSGMVRLSPNDLKISLLASDPASGETQDLYVNDPGIAGILADGVLHYPMWSPDSGRLAFVVVTRVGLSLFIQDVRGNADAEFVLARGPLWSSWSSDSQYLLVHRNEDHFLVDTLEGNQISELDIKAFRYRVPAWKPGDKVVTLTSEDESGGFTISTARVAGGQIEEPEPMLDLSGDPVFLWSPNGEFLAVAGAGPVLTYRGMRLFVYEGLTVIPTDRKKDSIVIEDSLLTFFWSPDGSKLAYVTRSDTPDVVRWMVLDVTDGSSWPLADFVPSQNQMVMFQFFDQYAYSHSLWSPDSSSLVFAGKLESGTVTASMGSTTGRQPAGPSIIVLGVEPNSPIKTIAEGIMAFWSPR